MIYKGKPFSVDFVWQDTAANSAKKLVETIKKYSLLVYGENFWLLLIVMHLLLLRLLMNIKDLKE